MLQDIKKRLYSLLIIIVVIVFGGSIGYYIILEGETSFIDCLYMTVISLTTVGYGEVVKVSGNVVAQIYTMVLLIFGTGIILYGISMMTALIVEGELSGILRKKKMEKQIKQLNGHFIVCGGGETGLALVNELLKNKKTAVLIEQDENVIRPYIGMEGFHWVSGDATDDLNLVDAGIERAVGVFVCLPSDKDNLYITMTARMMDPNVRIISRMLNDKIRDKLFTAGADRVVCPNSIGALRMASEMMRPAATDFLDQMLRSKQGNLRIHELVISNNSDKIGKTIMNSGIKDKYNLLVLGIKNEDDISFNPQPTQTLKEGMALIIMGEVDQIVKAQKHF